ncbi:MAG TPA: histidine kinase [Kribbella sp.]|nr:histidine kinase [Kribbella sp.]HZX02098.1 histidine kinase [Kribbella sp.]
MDAGLAGLVLTVTLLMLAGDSGQPGVRGFDLLAGGLAVLTAAPLLVRRTAPVAVLAVTAAASLVLVARGYALDFPVGPIAGMYGVAGQPVRRTVIALSIAGAFLLISGAAFVGEGRAVARTVGLIVVWAAGLAGAWFAGDRARLRRERAAEQALRAEHETERERRLAIAEERTRIARELHDSAGHAINVILVQAGAARLLQERDPAGSRKAITTIEDVARRTLTEISQLVSALRDDEAAPAPTSLEDLIESHRASGHQIVVETTGQYDEMPRPVSAAIYRILQEALTNASRHGAGGAEIVLRFGPQYVDATVTNTIGHSSSHGGHGIIGMRERATLLGGVLETATADSRFQLHAHIPYAREHA